MKYILILVITTLLLISCKKDQAVIPVQPVVIAQPDNIYYRNLPDFNLTNGYSDSIMSYFIDIDSNLVNDFKISAIRYSEPSPSAAHPGTLYFEKVCITSLDTSNKISGITNEAGCNNYGCPPVFLAMDSNMVINSALKYNTTNYLFNGDGRWMPMYTFKGNKYIGIILNNMYYGWIKIEGFGDGGGSFGSSAIIIKETAINKTAHNSIQSAQKN